MAKTDHYAFGNPNAGVSYDDSHLRNQRKGDPFNAQYGGANGERCIVHEVYPDQYTCDVFTEQGRYLTGVAWPGNGGNIRAPKRGELLGVHFELSVPTLYDARVDAARQRADAYRVTGTDGFGGEDPVYAGKGSNNQRGDGPKDVLPGDWIQSGDLGQLVAVLEGGTSVLKASELAQVIATQAGNLLRLVGQNMSMYTGAGTLDFVNEDGKTSMIFRAGADEETESSPSQDNFRIRAELGDDGEMVDFRVTDGQGRDVWRCHIDPDGRVQKVARRETAVYDEDLRIEVGTNETRIVDGSRSTQVGGDDTSVSRGDRRIQSGGSTVVQSGNDVTSDSRRDTVITSGRNMEFNAQGSLTSPEAAFQINVSNGGAAFVIGNPLAGSLPTGNLDITTYQGNININSLSRSISLNSPLPGGVKVGGPGPGIFGAMLFERFMIWVNAFGAALDTHFHVSPFLGLPTSPPTVPPFATTAAGLPAIRSNFVTLGG